MSFLLAQSVPTFMTRKYYIIETKSTITRTKTEQKTKNKSLSAPN